MAKPIDNLHKIKPAVTFYRVFAYIAGFGLLALVAEMVLKYSPLHVEIFAGGEGGFLYLAPVIAEPQCNWYSLFVPGGMGCEMHSTGTGLNISLMILIVHGWLYVVYVFACFRLWQMLRWKPMRLFVMLLGGVVPFLSFIVEARIHKIAMAEYEELKAKKKARAERRKAAKAAQLAAEGDA